MACGTENSNSKGFVLPCASRLISLRSRQSKKLPPVVLTSANPLPTCQHPRAPCDVPAVVARRSFLLQKPKLENGNSKLGLIVTTGLNSLGRGKFFKNGTSQVFRVSSAQLRIFRYVFKH